MKPEDAGVSFAVIVTRIDGQWLVREFDDDFSDIQNAITKVRNLRVEGPTFALLCVEDDYIVAVRPTPGRVHLLIGDATAAIEDHFAESVLNELGVDIDENEIYDDDEPWPEGDLDIFSDLGVSEQIVDVIVSDEDLWASEQAARLAEEMGFLDELNEAVGGGLPNEEEAEYDSYEWFT